MPPFKLFWVFKIVEHLAAEGPNISLRSWQRTKSELKERKILDLNPSGGHKHESK